MSGQQLVSVIVPCFNAERWIGQCLQSVVAQTYQPVETIVVDDGSQDNSLATVERFQRYGVRIVRQSNRGAPIARNVGLANSKGGFIQFLDADDLLSPEKIEMQVRALEQAPDYVSVSATMYFRDGTSPDAGRLDGGWPLVDTDDPVEWLIELMDPQRAAMVQPGSWLVPRSVCERAGEWRSYRALDDDGEYFCRVVLASRGIRRSRGGHNYYRQYFLGASLSAAVSPQMLWGGFFSLQERANHLLRRSNDPRLRRFLAGRFVERAVMAYPFCPQVTEAALSQARSLGGSDFFPSLGGRRIELIRSLFGWRIARRVSAISRALRTS